MPAPFGKTGNGRSRLGAMNRYKTRRACGADLRLQFRKEYIIKKIKISETY
jgi:hypothetical protein